MKSGRVSQTALKIALTMVTLNEKGGWNNRLPASLAGVSERLLLAAKILGYGPRLMRWSKTQGMVRFYNWYESIMPGIFEGIGERKIFMNEQLLNAIEAGSEQVLVLGAGFDTLCLRLAPCFPKVRFFEADHPATSAAKAKGVAQEGQPENLTLIAADLGKTSLSKVMAWCECWDAGARSTFVAEGLLLYLTADEVRNLFAEVAACSTPGNWFAFSHLVDLRDHPIARMILRLTGEPWLSSAMTAELAEYIGPGWKVITTREARPGRDLEGFAVVERLGPDHPG